MDERMGGSLRLAPLLAPKSTSLPLKLSGTLKNRKHFFVLSWTGFYHVFRVSWLLALRLRLVVAFNEMLRSDVCLPLLLLPSLTWGGNGLRLFCHTNLEPLNEAWGELRPAVGG